MRASRPLVSADFKWVTSLLCPSAQGRILLGGEKQTQSSPAGIFRPPVLRSNGQEAPDRFARLFEKIHLLFEIRDELTGANPRMQSSSPQLGFLLGTLAPFLRASDRPIAIACLRLVTTQPLPPFPEWSVPRFSLCIAFLTLSLAALPNFAMAPASKLAVPILQRKGSSCDPRITLSSDELECRNQREKTLYRTRAGE